MCLSVTAAAWGAASSDFQKLENAEESKKQVQSWDTVPSWEASTPSINLPVSGFNYPV